MTTTLSPGITRALQTASSPHGTFHILAIDHRDSIRVLINPSDPDGVPATEITDLKLAIVRHVAPSATAVMLDPVYSAAQAIVATALPGSVGFLAALEEQGYLGGDSARNTTLLDGWNVAKAKRLGASGVKLLIFYHPQAGRATQQQEELVRRVADECNGVEIPLFLEPMFYSTHAAVSVDTRAFAAERPLIVIESVRRLSGLGAHVMKVPFPIDARHETSDRAWRQACQQLNDACHVPWALLSGGDPFDSFKAQLRVACECGCSGFMAGRALWREAVSATTSERPDILRRVVLPRFHELSEIARRCGHPWLERHVLPTIDDHWFRTY
jgi:tagatose 1,6-diphosphate aldolase